MVLEVVEVHGQHAVQPVPDLDLHRVEDAGHVDADVHPIHHPRVAHEEHFDVEKGDDAADDDGDGHADAQAAVAEDCIAQRDGEPRNLLARHRRDHETGVLVGDEARAGLLLLLVVRGAPLQAEHGLLALPVLQELGGPDGHVHGEERHQHGAGAVLQHHVQPGDEAGGGGGHHEGGVVRHPGEVQPDLLAEVRADGLEGHVPRQLRDVHDGLLHGRELRHDVDGEVRVDDFARLQLGQVEPGALDGGRGLRFQHGHDELDAVCRAEDLEGRRVALVQKLKAVVGAHVIGAVDEVEGLVQAGRVVLALFIVHRRPLALHAFLQPTLEGLGIQQDPVVDAIGLLHETLHGCADLHEHQLEVVCPLHLDLQPGRGHHLRHAPYAVALDVLLHQLALGAEALVLVVHRHGDHVVVAVAVRLEERVAWKLRHAHDLAVASLLVLSLLGLLLATPRAVDHDLQKEEEQHGRAGRHHEVGHGLGEARHRIGVCRGSLSLSSFPADLSRGSYASALVPWLSKEAASAPASRAFCLALRSLKL
eukprot:scaffold31_cov263-Pinguiococcus_pyrenoidosus.AAC.59